MNAHTPTLITVAACRAQLIDTMQVYLTRCDEDVLAQVQALQVYYHGHLYVCGVFDHRTSYLGSHQLFFHGTLCGETQTVSVGW